MQRESRFRRRLKRAQSDTGWFSVKYNFLGPGVVAIVTFVLLLLDTKDFDADVVVYPVLAGFCAVVILYLAHFAWNFWRAGDRLALDDDEKAARIKAEQERDDALAELATAVSTVTGPPGPVGPAGPPGSLNLLASRAHITSTGGLAEFSRSTNVASVGKDATGRIIVTWAQDYADSDYEVTLNVKGGQAEIDDVSSGGVSIQTFAYGGTPEDAKDIIDIRVSALGEPAASSSMFGTEDFQTE